VLVVWRLGDVSVRVSMVWVMGDVGAGLRLLTATATRSATVALDRQLLRGSATSTRSSTTTRIFDAVLLFCIVTVDVIVGVVVFIVFHLSSRLNWKHYVFGLSIRLCVPSGGILRLACR